MNSLPGDVTRLWSTQKAYHAGHVLRTAALPGQRIVGRVMRGHGFAALRTADQAGRNEINGDLMVREIGGKRTGEPDQAGLGGHHRDARL